MDDPIPYRTNDEMFIYLQCNLGKKRRHLSALAMFVFVLLDEVFSGRSRLIPLLAP
jgi:hypothetical protein